MIYDLHKYKTSALTALLFVASSMLAAPAWGMFCSADADLAIADGTGSDVPGSVAVITIEVPANNTGTVTDLDFDLRIDHTFIGDLIVTLESPDNTVVTLLDRPGQPLIGATFGCGRDNIDVTLDDAAGTDAEDQCAVADPTMSGTHRPTGLLSDFNDDTFAGTWTLRVTDNAGQDLGTVISASNCISASTTPVTISSFETRVGGKSLIANWKTSSEAFNLGFHLWGNVDGDWQQLNQRLIDSRSFDSVVPQKYRHKINLLSINGEVTEVGISSVSSSGQEDFYGPFAIGEKYGEDTLPRYIDWAEQRTAHDQAMRDAGYIKVRQRWVKKTTRRAQRNTRQKKRFADALFEIKEPGVYRVSYEDLFAQGFDYRGMPVKKMALTRGGKAVPRIVRPRAGQRNSNFFGPGSEIVFFADGPSADTARYVDHAFYRLAFNSEQVLSAPNFDSAHRYKRHNPEALSLSNDSHYATDLFGQKINYSFTLPGDGWYDSAIRASGRSGVKRSVVTVPESALLDRQAKVSLSLLGGTNFQRVDADNDGELEANHHYKVYLNRTDYPEPIYDGVANGITFTDIEVYVLGQLQHGDNTVDVELLPDNGYNIDLAYFISGSLSYALPNVMSDAVLSFEVASSHSSIQVQDPAQSIGAVYSVDSDGNFAQQAFQRNDQLVSVDSLYNPSQRSVPRVWFVSDSGYLSPSAVIAAPVADLTELDLAEVDYVVIADASLIGADLQRFVQRQVELGRRTKVVSSQAVFAHYSDGEVLPHSIARYLADQALTSAYQYVLLVGGHTSNYRGYDIDPDNPLVNLIPSFYRSGGDYAEQIPTAVPFVDFDGDGAPDRAIGRWPVRDLTQLSNVVNKTLAWHADGSHRDQQTALFIADRKDLRNNFSESSQRLMPSLGLQYNPWPAAQTVFADAVIADDSVAVDDKIRASRDLLVNAINQGPALTVYSGHAAPTLWGKQSLVNADVVERFTNANSPSLMVPLACYTTYYETPSIKSLSELLFTDNESGAVAISAPALLSRAADNEHFGRSLLEEMTVSGLDLGSAVLKIKQQNHKYSPRHQTIVYNWVTLGDPTLSFGLANVRPAVPVDQPKKVAE